MSNKREMHINSGTLDGQAAPIVIYVVDPGSACPCKVPFTSQCNSEIENGYPLCMLWNKPLILFLMTTLLYLSHTVLLSFYNTSKKKKDLIGLLLGPLPL